MDCRLVGLNKEPGTHPIGIGKIYHRRFAKCVLEAYGSQATTACGNLIEGAIHAVVAVAAAAAADEENPGPLTQAELPLAAPPSPDTQDFMSDGEPDQDKDSI